jgi:phosphonate transport system permease protein
MAPDARPDDRAPSGRVPLSRRKLVLAGIVLAAALAALALDASLSGLVPREGGADLVRRFFARALSPAFDYEGEVPPGTDPLWLSALGAARRTLVFATAAMSLALVAGVPLGFLGSSAWWAGEERGGRSALARAFYRTVAPVVWSAARVLIVGMRSVHELLWAVLFLAALGLNNVTAVVAIAIPYAGTLAKIFSEMIDEAPRDAALALRGAGAGNLQVFAHGLVPRALPDMCAYAFYRFECAVRSSAILGFFGFPTLGYSISASFDNLHYGEVWTYLYALMALVVAVELWSGALRRRFVA